MSFLSLFINLMHFSWIKAWICRSGMWVQLARFYTNWNVEVCGSHWEASAVVWFPLMWSVNKKILLREDKTSKKHSHNPQIKPYTRLQVFPMKLEWALNICCAPVLHISVLIFLSQTLNSTDWSVLDSSHLKSVSCVPLSLIHWIIT